MRVPVKVVINRVVSVRVVLAAVSDVERRDSCMVLKRGVIGAIAESANANIGLFSDIGALIFRGSLNLPQFRAVLHGHLFFRVLHLASNVVTQMLQVVSPSREK